MAVIKVSDKLPIDFKYNLKVYFSFLKKYKGAPIPYTSGISTPTHRAKARGR